MLAKRYKNIIFDFDGTINNTAPGIYATFTEVLKRFGISADGTDLSEHIGPPLSYSYAKLVGEKYCREAVELHRRIFAETEAVKQSFLYDGIIDVLDKLYYSGKYALSIASCKYQPHIAESLVYHKIDKYFDCVYGQTDKRGYKSEVLRQLIDDNGWARKDCLMIGDTMHDVDGANQNGIDVVAVTYGFEKREILQKANVAALVDNPSDILKLLL